jgi:transposase
VNETDARSWSQAEQARVRCLAVKAVLGGTTFMAAAAQFGVSEPTISNWMRRYHQGGEAALAPRRRGRAPAEQMALLPWQQAQIVKAIREKNPDQLKLPFYLWTRAAVGDLIERRFGIRLAVRTVGNYLRRWGFTPQKPVRRAFEQDSEAVRTWLDDIYPAIAKKAKREGAHILWGDEMGLRSDHSSGTSWSPRGKTPVIKGTGKRFGCNVISAISNQGKLHFMVFDGRANADLFISFLRRLLRQAKGRKIYLIVDGHPSHRAKKVKQFIARNAELIALYFLPPYSPELNPDEMLNQDVKAGALSRRRPTSLTQLITNTRSYLRSRQRQPNIVANYFREKHVRYAAAV